MIKANIVDDESKSIETLQLLLEKFCPKVVVTGIADNFISARNNLENNPPDLLFLDIKLNEGSGFNFLESIDYPGLEVIFTTAYSEHALRAFKVNALGYILKPIDAEDLINCVNKAEKIISSKKSEPPSKTTYSSDKIAIPTNDGFSLISINDINKCVACDNYTYVHLRDKKILLVSKSLKDFEETLSKHSFFRAHHSCLVNLTHVLNYNKSGYLTLADGSIVEVSKRRKPELLNLFSSFRNRPI